MTVFGDWESITILDPDHSEAEERGSSSSVYPLEAECWLFLTSNEARMYESSAQGARMPANGENMPSKVKHSDEMRSHYDFSGGERGKYAARYAEGANVVVLAPDVAAMFPDSVAVNEALRTFVRMSARTVRARAVAKKRGS